MNLYEVHCKVKSSGPKCEMPADIKSAFVSIFVPAQNIMKSYDGAKAVLSQDSYQLLDVERIIKMPLDDWDHYRDEVIEELEDGDDGDDDVLPTTEAVREYIDTCCAFYGPFVTYQDNQ
jgi:hypothetical protein